MTREEIIQHFKRLLKEEGVFGQYLIYNKRYSKYANIKYPYWKQGCPQSYISNAFSWVETAEGSSFWVGMDAKWAKILKDNNAVLDLPF